MHFGAKWAFGQLNKIDTSMQTGKPFKKQPLVLAIGVAIALMSGAHAQAPASATVSDVPPPVSAASIAASVAADKAKKSEIVASNNDLLSLYQEAANNDPVFLSARYAYDAGREKRWQGFAGLLPQVVATGNETQNDFTRRGNTETRFMSRGWAVRLTQPLFSWDKWETARQGFISSDIAAAQYAAAEQDLVIRVTEAYFNVLNAQDTLNLARNKKALIAEQLEQAKRNFEVGTATITDTHEAQSRFDLVVAQEIAAQADLTIKRGALEQIVGKPIGELKSLAPEAKISLVVNEDPKTARSKLANKSKKKTTVTQEASKNIDVNAVIGVAPTQSMNDWVSQAEDVSYSVVASKLSYEVAKRETSKSVGGHLPSVELVGQRSYTDSESFNALTSGTLPIQSFSTQGIVQLTVPIFSSGYTQSVVREKAALEKKALSDYQNTRRSIAQATRQAFLGFNQGLAQVKAYEAAEISAMSALESNKLGYEVGVRINIDVLNAQDTLFTTRRDLAKARYDTILNGLRLKAQAAVLSSEDLQAVNALLK
ncbi:TolC family protein [Polynucleobacter sp. MWH-Loch1C5]|uniref:TolC family protein n=1 Tax=Polynucleobacter sp. MWH-Loch1C5 TaxID=2689108 RepID=UPI001C0B993C|nr:TolC family protein [Polynucleobacter sp. MWH-Loch1C5]MBU3542192.1 TolC family protein [Polynucleobacter sp. MWH-Loch1C5]